MIRGRRPRAAGSPGSPGGPPASPCRRLSTSLAGQLVVSETVFALIYAFAWLGDWPETTQLVACAMFLLGVVASIRAHR